MIVELKNLEQTLTFLFKENHILPPGHTIRFTIEKREPAHLAVNMHQQVPDGREILLKSLEVEKNQIIFLNSFLRDLPLTNGERDKILKSLKNDFIELERTNKPEFRDITAFLRRTTKEEALMPIVTEHVFGSKFFEQMKNHPVIRQRAFDQNGELLQIFGISERMIANRIMNYSDIKQIVEDSFKDDPDLAKINVLPKSFEEVLKTAETIILDAKKTKNPLQKIYSFIVSPHKRNGHTLGFVLMLENEKIKIMSVDSVSSTEALDFTNRLASALSKQYGNLVEVGHRRLITQRENTMCGAYAVVDALEHLKNPLDSFEKFEKLKDFEQGRKYLADKILRILDKMSILDPMKDSDKRDYLEDKLVDYMVYFSAMRLSREAPGKIVSDEKIQRLFDLGIDNFSDYIDREMFVPSLKDVTQPLIEMKARNNLLKKFRGSLIMHLPEKKVLFNDQKKNIVNEILNGTIDMKKFTKNKVLPDLKIKNEKTKEMINENMALILEHENPDLANLFQNKNKPPERKEELKPKKQKSGNAIMKILKKPFQGLVR